ncbi:hypothetical protein D3C84_486680 [compost metagenome]
MNQPQYPLLKNSRTTAEERRNQDLIQKSQNLLKSLENLKLDKMYLAMRIIARRRRNRMLRNRLRCSGRIWCRKVRQSMKRLSLGHLMS